MPNNGLPNHTTFPMFIWGKYKEAQHSSVDIWEFSFGEWFSKTLHKTLYINGHLSGYPYAVFIK